MHLPAARAPLALLSILTALALPTASTVHLADLNSLQAFLPATSTEELSILSPGHISGNLTSTDLQTTNTPLNSSPPPSAPNNNNDDDDDSNSPDPLLKRDGSCGSYNSCSTLGAPSLCCAPNRICSADALGRVGCCPSGAACTGTIPGAGGVVPTSSSAFAGYSTTSVTTATSVPATTTVAQTEGGGFIIAGSSTVAVFGQGTNAAGSVQVVSGFWLRCSGWRVSCCAFADLTCSQPAVMRTAALLLRAPMRMIYILAGSLTM